MKFAMKFILPLLGLPLSTMADWLGEDKCCRTISDTTWDPTDFLETAGHGISGYTSQLCFDDGCPDGFVLITNEELCGGNTVPADDGVYCENASGEREGSDIPWSCAVRIGYNQGQMTTSTSSYGSDTGFYCGQREECKLSAVVCGDPHIQTWSGDWFDFHGACDLVFVKDEEFAQGLGLAIHLRTTGRYEYSYVETAAIQIGDDVLEVSSFGNYLMNGVEHAKLDGIKMGGLFRIEYEEVDQKTHTYNIIVSEGKYQGIESIQIKTFKDLVSVKFTNAYEESFATSVGLMGNFHTGARLGRDGTTLIEDANEFGMEWQVRPEEPMLFQVVREPQLSSGQQCVMPSKSAEVERRRLGEGVPLEAAVAACEAVDHIHHENCVYDVMATGDLEIAHSGVF